MVGIFDYGYISTPTGQFNIAELVCLIGALISIGFTSRSYCELVDNLQWIYPDLNTVIVRSVFQVFSILCLTVTLAIFLIHIYGIRFTRRNFSYINQICIICNIIMGLMMISIGICAAFWEDKLRRTPGIIRRGYYLNKYQYIFGEITHPRPGAAAAAATFAILVGILFLIEACTRPMLNSIRRNISTDSLDRTYKQSIISQHLPIKNNNHERIIPIEIIKSTYSQAQV